MKENIRKYIIIGLLPVAMIWGYFNIFGNNKKAISNSDLATASPAVNPTVINSAKIDTTHIAKFDWGSDPFYRGYNTGRSSVARTFREWSLGGIVYDEENPYAIINNRIVRQGDAVDGALVQQIEETFVLLNNNGKNIRLTVSKDKS